MRGDDTNQSSIRSWLSPKQRVLRDHLWSPTHVMADVVLKGLPSRFVLVLSPYQSPLDSPPKLLSVLLCFGDRPLPFGPLGPVRD